MPAAKVAKLISAHIAAPISSSTFSLALRLLALLILSIWSFVLMVIIFSPFKLVSITCEFNVLFWCRIAEPSSYHVQCSRKEVADVNASINKSAILTKENILCSLCMIFNQKQSSRSSKTQKVCDCYNQTKDEKQLALIDCLSLILLRTVCPRPAGSSFIYFVHCCSPFWLRTP